MSTNPTTSNQPTPMRTGEPAKLTPEKRRQMIDEATAKKAAEEAAKTTVETVVAKTKTRVTAPWQDLPAGPKQIQPRDGSVFAQALKTLEAKPDGATLDEIKASFAELKGTGPNGTMLHHDVKTLLKWQSDNKGWGFKMDPKTGKITVVRASSK